MLRSAGDFGIMAGILGSRAHEKSSNRADSNTVQNQEYFAVFNVSAYLFSDLC
jgi:hypothetical protein